MGPAGRFEARCPLPDHDDHHPSFHIYDGSSWYCFGCNRWGDSVELEFCLGRYNSRWEAMLSLARRYGVELPERPAGWYARQKRQRLVRDALRRIKADVLRRRIFRWCVLPLVDAAVSDPGEHAEEVRRAWEEFQRLPDAMFLNLLERNEGGDEDAAA